MAPRSNWKGYLKLSLVSASIAIYPATSATEKVSSSCTSRVIFRDGVFGQHPGFEGRPRNPA